MKKFLILPVLFVTFASIAHAQWTEPTLTPPSGNVTAPLRLDGNGRLGIGLTGPGKIFEVATEIVSRASSASGDVAASFAADTLGANLWVNSAYNPAAPTSGWMRGLTLTPAGNLGIGLTNPGSKVDIIRPGNANVYENGIRVNRPDAAGNYAFVGYGQSSSDAYFGSTYTGAAGSYGQIHLRQYGQAGAFRDALNIVSSGNVGIGTIAPNEPLEVANATNGGRIIASDGQGATRRTLLLVSPTAATPSSRIESYNYATSLGLPLYINSSGGGNVSIGNIATTYRLNVAGDVNVPTGSCYRVNGTCLSSGGMTGSGTTNTLAMFTAASTLGDSRLSQQADGSVRTTSPTGWVDIGPKNTGFNHIYTDRPATIFNTGVWAISGIFSAYNTDNLRLQTNGTDRITALASNGNVGIGTNLPTQRLTVEGNINKTGSWILSGNANWGPNSLEVYNSSWDGASNNNYGTIAAGHVYSYNGLQSGGPSGNEAGDGQLYVAGTSMLMGNVGIGKNNPSNTLDVAGGMSVAASVDGSSLAFINNTHPSGGIGLSATAQINGLYGYAQNTNGWGVRGVGGGSNGTGVRGEGYYGVRGQASNGPPYVTYGVYGATEGIYGSGAYGIYCHATSPSSLCGGNKSWTNTSDLRLKKNISTITNGLDKVLKLRGVNYQWKEGDTKTENIGFIAQEVLEVVPEVVSKGADGYYTMKESSLSAVLVEAIKELKAENDDLKTRIEKLEAKLK